MPFNRSWQYLPLGIFFQRYSDWCALEWGRYALLWTGRGFSVWYGSRRLFRFVRRDDNGGAGR